MFKAEKTNAGDFLVSPAQTSVSPLTCHCHVDKFLREHCSSTPMLGKQTLTSLPPPCSDAPARRTNISMIRLAVLTQYRNISDELTECYNNIVRYTCKRATKILKSL